MSTQPHGRSRRLLVVEQETAKPVVEVINPLDALLDALADRIAARLTNGAAAQPDQLLTPDQAAKLLGTDRRWLYRHSAELGAVRLSRRKLRFKRSGLERFITRGRR